MITYRELKKKHQAEYNAFPIQFAFMEKQFREGMAEFGLTPSDTDQVYFIGAGGFIRKSDLAAYDEMVNRHEKERAEAMASDTTGNGFLFQMFYCELVDHEYSWSECVDDTVDALGLTDEDFKNNPLLGKALKKACLKLTA